MMIGSGGQDKVFNYFLLNVCLYKNASGNQIQIQSYFLIAGKKRSEIKTKKTQKASFSYE